MVQVKTLTAPAAAVRKRSTTLATAIAKQQRATTGPKVDTSRSAQRAASPEPRKSPRWQEPEKPPAARKATLVRSNSVGSLSAPASKTTSRPTTTIRGASTAPAGLGASLQPQAASMRGPASTYDCAHSTGKPSAEEVRGESPRSRKATCQSTMKSTASPRQHSSIGPALTLDWEEPPCASGASTANPPSPELSPRSSPELGYRSISTKTEAKTAPTEKSNSFGTGERVEPTEWKRWANAMDKRRLGAHYSHVVGELPANLAQEDSEKHDYDVMLVDDLHQKRPEELPRPRSPRPPASAAFTDRALRLREGKGARTALMSNDPVPEERGDRGLCNSMSCHSAGQPSHMVHSNRAARCAGDQLLEPEEASPTFHSGVIATAMQHMEEKLEIPLESEELEFTKNMGRKVKPARPTSPGGATTLTHRSPSCDAVPAAGSHDQELASEISTVRAMRRQPWQGKAGEEPPRSGSAFVLSPRESDPPAPSQVCSARKADGVYKAGYSEESKQLSTHYNQEQFRFEDARMPRGRSQPAPRLSASFAGAASGEWGNHMWKFSNPLTMQGKDLSPRALGDQRRPSPSPSFRKNLGNSSRVVATVINHDEVDRQWAADREHRLQAEPAFAALCTTSQETMEWGSRVGRALKQRDGQSLAGALRWTD